MKQRVFKFFSKLDPILKIDTSYFLSGGFWLTTSRFFIIPLSFFLSVVLANTLTKDDYGIYQYVISIFSLLLVFSLPGMNTAVSQAIAQKKIFSIPYIIRTKIKYALIASFGSLIISLYYFYQNNELLGLIFLLITLFAPFFDTYQLYRSILIGRESYKGIGKSDFFITFWSTLIIASVALLTKNIFFILISYLIYFTSIRYYYFRKVTTLTKQYNEKKIKPTSKDVKHYGLHLSILSILSVAAKHLDKILLFTYLGPIHLAVYALALKPIDIIVSFFKNSYLLLLPKFATKQKISVTDMIVRKKMVIFLFPILCILIYTICIPYFYKIFFPTYIDSVQYTIILSLTLLPTWILLIFRSILDAKKMIRAIWIQRITNQGTTLLLVFILTFLYGMYGTVIALTISSYVNLFSSYLIIRFFEKE